MTETQEAIPLKSWGTKIVAFHASGAHTRYRSFRINPQSRPKLNGLPPASRLHMSSSLKFPPTVEIKRAIAAVLRAGVQISSVEIHPRKIVIHSKDEVVSELDAYDLWKLGERKDTSRVRHEVGKTDGHVKKPRG